MQQVIITCGDDVAVDMLAEGGPVRQVLANQGLNNASDIGISYQSPIGSVSISSLASTRVSFAGWRNPVDWVSGTTFYNYSSYDSTLDRTYYDRILGSQTVEGLFVLEKTWGVSFIEPAQQPTLATVLSSSIFDLIQVHSVVIYGSDLGDRLMGFNLDDMLWGWDGNDSLYGASGNDTLNGGAGADALYGGDGADVLSASDATSAPAGTGNGPDEWIYAGSGNDSVFGSRGRDLIRGGAGDDYLASSTDMNDRADSIWGEAGNDNMWSGRGDDWLHGGRGNDTVDGSYGNDTLIGGKGNDHIIGGGDNELDIVIFETTQFVNRWSRFNLTRQLTENQDSKYWEVAVASPTEGVDTMESVDIGQFTNGRHSLSYIEFVINRTPDGEATGRIFDGNEVISLTNLLNGPSLPINQPLSDMRYDTLLPLGPGTYSGYYRLGGGLGNRIELSSYDADQGQVRDGDVLRTNVQIHGGRHNGNSEGCFLFSGNFRTEFFNYLDSLVPGNEMGLGGAGYYFPVIPMTIYVNGAAPQSKVIGVDEKIARPAAGAGANSVEVQFDLVNDTTPHYRKNMDIFFTVSADRKDGWNFAGGLGAEPASGSQTNYSKVWKEGSIDGQDVYGVRVGVRSNGDMKSLADFDVLIFDDAPGKLDFRIIDVDLWSKRGDYDAGDWHLYAISDPTSAPADQELFDTDGPNKAEASVLTGPNSDGRTATLTVSRTTPPRIDSDGDLAWI